MAWGKLDDKLHASVKWRRASKGARALWTTALSWCSDQENGGHVPADMLKMLDGTHPEATSLVSARLWNKVEDGWEFHNWHEYNPDAASAKAKRDAESLGGKRGNHARWHVKQGITVPDCEFCTPSGGESGTRSGPDQGGESGANPPDPTRPGPTQTSPKGDVGKRATRLPTDWQPTPEHEARAKEDGTNIDREVVKFKAHAEDRGVTSKSWNARFTRWLMNAAEYAQRDRTQGRPLRAVGPTTSWMDDT